VAAEGGFPNDVNAHSDVLVDRGYILANQRVTYTNRFRVAGAKLRRPSRSAGRWLRVRRDVPDDCGAMASGQAGR
jgi:hypothetical protein